MELSGISPITEIFLLMKKTERYAGDTEGVGLSGAVYLLERYNEETGRWEYAQGTEEEASLFTVTQDVVDGEMVTGARLSGNMAPGRYRVIEQTAPAPDGIQNSAGVTVEFTVDPTPIEFTITAGATVERTQWDGIKRSLKVIKKTDDKNDSEALEGATFELWTYKDASEEGLTSEYDRIAAHKDAQIQTAQTTGADGVVVWNGLEPGKYVLLETDAPEGYVRTAQIVEIAESTSWLDVEQTLDVVNESNMGRIVIQKQDANGNVICDDDGKTAVFAIYQADDTDYSDLMTTVTVSEDGTGISGLLPVGEYLVVETQAPDGYPLDDRLEQNILEKKVTVSGDQNPVANFSGVSATAEDGYTDLVIFQNRSAASIQTFQSSIDKTVRLENGTGYTETVNSEDSLMNQEVDAWFLLSGLTDGHNELPADSFVVTDEIMAFQALTEGSTDNYYTYETGEALTAEDYVMNQLRLYKSFNQDSSAVRASVEAKVGGAWALVQTDVNLTDGLADGGYVTVDLPENATGFRVSYSNAGVGFLAGNIEVNVTFKQRKSDAEAPEIRRIINTATLRWEDTMLDNKRQPAHLTGNASDTASVTFSGYTENLPILSLHNEITSSGSAAGYYYSGDTVEFTLR